METKKNKSAIIETSIAFNTGYILEFRPISQSKLAKINLQVLKEFEERKEPLDHPQYELSNGEMANHDEETLKAIDPITNEIDEKQAEIYAQQWNDYQDATERLNEKQSQKTFRYIMLNGITTDFEPSKKWLKEEKEFSDELPSDKDELKILYLLDEILVSQHNKTLAYARPLFLAREGEISDIEVEAIENSFRDIMDTRELGTTTSTEVNGEA